MPLMIILCNCKFQHKTAGFTDAVKKKINPQQKTFSTGAECVIVNAYCIPANPIWWTSGCDLSQPVCTLCSDGCRIVELRCWVSLPTDNLCQKKKQYLSIVFFLLLVKRTGKKATQPQALSPYNPTAGYPLDVNSGNKASICCLYEVGAE